MSFRITYTYICDECGRLSEHEKYTAGYAETICTRRPYPRDWLEKRREGGGDLTPRLDYCPTCKPKILGDKL